MKGSGLISNTSDYFRDSDDAIGLESCSRDGIYCNHTLNDINKHILNSRNYRLNKNYDKAISELKSGFQITYDVKEATCQKCTALFRNVIINLMEQLVTDLKYMTSGLFKRKKLIPLRKESELVLNEMLNH